MTNKPIFFDATGRRAARLSLFGWTAAVVSTVLGIAFIASLVVAPQMEQVNFTNRLTAVHLPELEKKATDPGLLKAAARLAAEARAALAKRIEQSRLRHQKIARAAVLRLKSLREHTRLRAIPRSSVRSRILTGSSPTGWACTDRT